MQNIKNIANNLRKMDNQNFYNEILNESRTDLNEATKEKLKKDAMLYGKVADELKVSPLSFVKYLYRKNKKLIQVNVLDIIVEHLRVQDTAA